MPKLQARIEPFDPLLFGDNRSARAGQDHALTDQDPSPATLYGLLGARVATALGGEPRPGELWKARVEPVLGRFEAKLKGDDDHRSELLGHVLCDAEGRPWFPRPAHLRVRRIGESLHPLDLLRPVPEDGESVLSSLQDEEGDGPRRLVSAGGESGRKKVDEVEEPLLVDETMLAAALTGQAELPRHQGWARTHEDFFKPEARIGLALDNDTSTAVEGRLFSRPYRRFGGRVLTLEKRWRSPGYLAWYRVLSLTGRGPAGWSGIGFAGGDRGRAFVDFAALEDEGGGPLGKLKAKVLAAAAGSHGFLVVLLTPAVAEHSWPSSAGTWPQLGGRHPVAAALGRSLHMSGWSTHEGSPRPLRTLLGAGTVFFFEWESGDDEETRRQVISDNWLEPLDRRWRNTGFGRMLVGVWR